MNSKNQPPPIKHKKNCLTPPYYNHLKEVFAKNERRGLYANVQKYSMVIANILLSVASIRILFLKFIYRLQFLFTAGAEFSSLPGTYENVVFIIKILETKWSCWLKKLLFDCCKFLIRNKIVNNKNLNEKFVFIALI